MKFPALDAISGTITFFVLIYITTLYDALPFGDFVSTIGVMSAILIFFINRLRAYSDHVARQKKLLEGIMVELDILTKENLILETPIHGHIPWYSETVSMERFPLHRIKELNADIYLIELDAKFDGEDTREVKRGIQLINDKISMVNSLTERLVQKDFFRTKIQREKAYNSLCETLPELEKLVFTLKALLIERFRVYDDDQFITSLWRRKNA